MQGLLDLVQTQLCRNTAELDPGVRNSGSKVNSTIRNDPFPVYEKCYIVCVKQRERFIFKLGS